MKLILSCEHGGAEIPRAFEKFFKNSRNVLKTHRALDIGALPIAKDMARITGAPLDYATVSRLIVDLNRSLGSRSLFSSYTKSLSRPERKEILTKHYFPYRRKIEGRIAKEITRGTKVVHVSVHSFTPVLNGVTRTADLAVLYDPKHPGERKLGQAWYRELVSRFPEYRIRRNNPYKGTSDGVTRLLRKTHPVRRYIGIEIEMNQKIVGSFRSSVERNAFSKKLTETLLNAISEL